MSSKVRRKVTVDMGKSDESDKRKPSVFERLGPGGGQRKYEYDSDSPREEKHQNQCLNWMNHGTCKYGSSCKYTHPPLKSGPSKRKESYNDNDSPDGIRLKFKGHKNKKKRADSSESPERPSRSKAKRDKDKMRSTVTIKKAGYHSDDDSEESGRVRDVDEMEDLDYAEELHLQQKRQQLEQALSLLPASEEEERENITIERRLGAGGHDSETTPQKRGHSKRKKPLSAKKKTDKKKRKTSRQRSSSPEEHEKKKHGKHKRKSKKHLDTESDDDSSSDQDMQKGKKSKMKQGKRGYESPGVSPVGMNKKSRSQTPSYQDQKRPKPLMAPSTIIPSLMQSGGGQKEGTPRALMSVVPARERGDRREMSAERTRDKARRPQNPSVDRERERGQRRSRSRDEHEDRRPERLMDLPVQERGRHSDNRPIKGRRPLENSSGSSESDSSDDSSSPEEVVQTDQRIRGDRRGRGRDMPLNTEGREQRGREGRGRGAREAEPRTQPPSPPGRFQGSRRMPELMSTRADSPDRRSQGRRRPLMPESTERGGRVKDPRRSPPPEFIDARSHGSGPRRAVSPESYHSDGARSPGRHQHRLREISPFEQSRNRFRERDEEFERGARRSISPTEFRRRRDGSNPREGFRGGEMRIHGDLPGRERFEPQPTTTYRDDRQERFPEDIPPFDSRARFEAERREFEQERFDPERERFEMERYDPERFQNRSDSADPWYETERGRGPRADPFELPPGEFPEEGWGRNRNRRGSRGRPQRDNGRGRGERFPGRGRGRRSDERGGRSQMRLSRRGDWENQRGEVFPHGEHELWPERVEEREDRRREELVGQDRPLRREGRSNERPEGRHMDRLLQEREEGRHPREEGRYPREDSRPPREDSRPPRDEGRPARDEGRPPRDEGRPQRDEGRPREEGRPPREDSRLPRVEGRPLRDEGRPAREDGRQSREEGRPPRDESRPPRDEGRPPRDEGRSLREDGRQAKEEGRQPRDEGRPPRDDEEVDQRGRRDEDRLERREEGWEKRRNTRRGRPLEEEREEIHEDPRKRPLDYDQRALSPSSKRFRDVSPISIESRSSENSADKGGNDVPRSRKRGEKPDRHRREPSDDSGPGDIVEIRRLEKEQALQRQRELDGRSSRVLPRDDLHEGRREKSLRGSPDREIRSPDRESSASRARSKTGANKDIQRRKEKDVPDTPSKERQDKEGKATRGRRESPNERKADNKLARDRSEASSRDSRDRSEVTRRDGKDREGSSRNGRELEEPAKRDERDLESSRRGKARGETSNKDDKDRAEKSSPVNRERSERERKETSNRDVRERERENISGRDDRRARGRRSKGGKDRQVDIQTRLLGYAEGYKGTDRARERRNEPEVSERDNRKEVSDERRGKAERRSKKAIVRSDDNEIHETVKGARDKQAKEKESSLRGDESVDVPDTPSSPAKEEEKPRTESQALQGVEQEPAQADDKEADVNEPNEIQPIKSPSIKQDTEEPEQTIVDEVIEEEDGGPEVFSDWSDDPSAEDILNQPEDKQTIVEQLRRESDERPRSSPSRSSYGSRYSGERARYRQVERHRRPASRPSSRERRREDRRRNEGGSHRNGGAMENGRQLHESKTMDVDEALQFEYDSISSEEGDLLGAEDKDGKTSVFDALNIDWSSLMQDHRPKQPTGSALQRFQPANLLASIGVSRAYAGEALYERIKVECQSQLTKQHQENARSADDDSTNIDKDAPVFELHSDVAAFHTTISKKMKDRAHLLQNIGPYRRALCARKDLDIRKRLCKVEKSLDQPPVYPVQVIDNDLCKLGIQLFRQSQEREKKDLSTLLPKTEVSCS